MEGVRRPRRSNNGTRGQSDVSCRVLFAAPSSRAYCCDSEGAKDLVEDYYKAQGGRPQKPAPKKRKSTGQTKSASENAEPKKPRKSKGATTKAEVPNEAELPDWVPKGKNWENEVDKVDTIMRDETNDLCAYLHWKSGRKSKVSVETCYDRCPKKVSFHLVHSVDQQLTHSKMLKFYESHL